MERPEFEALALDQLDAVYRMAYHLTHNAESAQDLVQEVYLRAFQPGAVAAFSPTGGGIRSWLFTICHNTFYSQIKKRSRERGQDGAAIDLAASHEPMPGEPAVTWRLSDLDWDHVDGAIKAAIDELSPEYREVLLLWGVEGLKYREIAVIVGVPIGTVMSRLHRARQAVGDRIAAAREGRPAAKPDAARASADAEVKGGTRVTGRAQRPLAALTDRFRMQPEPPPA